MPPQLPWPGQACSAIRVRVARSGSPANWKPVTRSIRSPVCGSMPGLIDPSDSSTAGALCSRIAASVPTGGLSQATTAISPATLLALRCRSMFSLTSSRPINEKRMQSVPFSCPSETPIV